MEPQLVNPRWVHRARFPTFIQANEKESKKDMSSQWRRAAGPTVAQSTVLHPSLFLQTIPNVSDEKRSTDMHT